MASLLELPSEDLCCRSFSFRLPGSPSSCHSPRHSLGHGVFLEPDSATPSIPMALDVGDFDGELPLTGHRISFSFEGIVSDAADIAITSCCCADDLEWVRRSVDGEVEDEKGKGFEFSSGAGAGELIIQSGYSDDGASKLVPSCSSPSLSTMISTDRGVVESISANGDENFHAYGHHQRATSLDLLSSSMTAGSSYHRRQRQKLQHKDLSFSSSDEVEVHASGGAGERAGWGSTSTSAEVSGESVLVEGTASMRRRRSKSNYRRYASKLAELLMIIKPFSHSDNRSPTITKRKRLMSSSSSSSSSSSRSSASLTSASKIESNIVEENKAESMVSSYSSSSMTSTRSRSQWRPFPSASNIKNPDDGHGEEEARSSSTMWPLTTAAAQSSDIPPERRCSSSRRKPEDGDDGGGEARSRSIGPHVPAAVGAQSFEIHRGRSCNTSRNSEDGDRYGERRGRRTTSVYEFRPPQRSHSTRSPSAGHGSSPLDAAASIFTDSKHRSHRAKASPGTSFKKLHTNNMYENAPWEGLRKSAHENIYRTPWGHNKNLYPVAISPILNLAPYRRTPSKTFKLRDLLLCKNMGKEKPMDILVKC